MNSLTINGHARLRGPFTAAGSYLRVVFAGANEGVRHLFDKHDIEVLTAAPELADRVTLRRASLTYQASTGTRTRYYPHNRTEWIANGLADLALAHAELAGSQTLVIEHADAVDRSDSLWLDALSRRARPESLRLILADRGEGAEGPAGMEDAERYVAGDCLDETLRAAYESIDEGERAALHDRRADELEATGEPSWLLGAVPWHRERGADPTGRGVEALERAMTTCLMAGSYDALLGLGERLRRLVGWDERPTTRWLATVKMTIAYQTMARPDEAMALYDEACANSADASIHMQSAYGRAMLFTRYFPDERKDHLKAKGLVNTAIALAALSEDAERRAYNRTFNENGLALIEMHLGAPQSSLKLVDEGIARLEAEVEDGRFMLHRSVLRYNRAQLMVKMGTLDQAIDAYSDVIREDPFHPDYYFERAGLLEKAGRFEEAIVDYGNCISVTPPFAEPHYNRAELELALGDTEAALADYGRTLELDPAMVNAYVNRAALLIELGLVDQARADVDAGLEVDASNPHLLCLRGVVSEEAGQLDDAAAAYRAAIAIDATMAGAWAGLGGVQFAMGDVSDARESLLRSLVLEENPEVRANLNVVTQTVVA
jgi:tetratricopeptide (TPR) repeat protein